MRSTLADPLDAASLGVFRFAFGALMLLATVRFAVYGWIDELYIQPRFHFKYWGFAWVRPWHEYDFGGYHLPTWCMYGHFALLGLAALLVALGAWYRVAIVALFLLFGYVELLDVTNYLNHYYALSIIGGLLCFIPAHRVASIDAMRAERRGLPMPRTIPRAAIWALRAQLGLVYFFAGVAKLNSHWLFEAEPLRSWLLARSDSTLLGRLFALEVTAYAMSWSGCLFDLCAPWLLAYRRTRALTYVVVVVFHLATARLFQIGIFAWVMIALTPIFFDASWPRWLFRQMAPAPTPEPSTRRLAWPIVAALAVHFALQLALPMRHRLYAGDVLWNEMGMRYAWHVMIAERAGLADIEAVDEQGRHYVIDTRADLTPLQMRMMATQPDLILQYAHHVRDDFARRGHRVEVHADVWVSLNGEPSRQLVDPRVDLAAQEDGLSAFDWVRSDSD